MESKQLILSHYLCQGVWVGMVGRQCFPNLFSNGWEKMSRMFHINLTEEAHTEGRGCCGTGVGAVPTRRTWSEKGSPGKSTRVDNLGRPPRRKVNIEGFVVLTFCRFAFINR